MPAVLPDPRRSARGERLVDQLAAPRVRLGVAAVAETEHRVPDAIERGTLGQEPFAQPPDVGGQFPVTVGRTHDEIHAAGVEVGRIHVTEVDHRGLAEVARDIVRDELGVARLGAEENGDRLRARGTPARA